MRKIFTFIVLAISQFIVNAQTVKINDITYTLNSSDMSATIVSGTSGDIMIPATVSYNGNKYDVAGIGSEAFYWNYNGVVTSIIVMSKKITSVGQRAFMSCNGLKMFNAPTTEYIGVEAFSNCQVLEDVDVSFVKEIGNGAFLSDSKLKRLSTPCLITVGYRAFKNCSALETIELGNVTSLDNEAFRSCTSLKNVFLPNIRTLGAAAFSGDVSVESIYLGENLERLYDDTFYNCSKVKSFTCCVEVPPITTSTTFEGMDKASCILYVPEESVDYYKMAVNWKDFKNIKPIKNETTGVGNIANDEVVDVYSVNGNIVLKNTTIESAKLQLKGVYVVNNRKYVF